MRSASMTKGLACAGALVALVTVKKAEAQDPAPENDEAPMSRDASGTAWAPGRSAVHAIHGSHGGWDLMGHGSVFLQYLRDEDPRGLDQAGSINWFMGMAARPLGAGRLGVKAMMSLEPLTIGGCGYPDLLASGERCNDRPIVDQQHPHDLFMELAATWEGPSARGMGVQIYGGPVGEPALGPVAFPHRISALANPVAPISHHWLDATHVTFGVVTLGVHGRRWKAEGSVFNGREPDENRYDFDLAPLDSYSARLWFLPTPGIALQVSAGRLSEAELGEPAGDPQDEGEHGLESGGTHAGLRVDVARFTASATYHRTVGEGPGVWASTVAWGRNRESGENTDFFLAETALSLAGGDTWFGRLDAGQKDAHDLNVLTQTGTFAVAKLQGGYVHYFAVTRAFETGLGATGMISVFPESLRDAYGGRSALGVGVFFTLRPREMMMTAGKPHAGHQH